MKRYLLILFLPVLLAGKCRKESVAKPELPPATQEGKNTIGCYINGEPWTPQGYRFRPNFFIIVDPGFQNGGFDLRAYRLEGNKEISLSIASLDLKATGEYPISPTGKVYINYRDDNNSCFYNFSTSNFCEGKLSILKYDLSNGIVSGLFEFKLYDPTIGCDTVKITQGRFDYKM